MQKFFDNWLPPIIWCAVIFLFSSQPTAQTSQIHWQDFIVKKMAHIFEYAILAALFYRALRKSALDAKKAILYAFLFSVFYGFTDEFHQSFTPGREPRFRDVIFDTIGAAISLFIIWKLLPKAPKRLLNWAEKLGFL